MYFGAPRISDYTVCCLAFIFWLHSVLKLCSAYGYLCQLFAVALFLIAKLTV